MARRRQQHDRAVAEHVVLAVDFAVFERVVPVFRVVAVALGTRDRQLGALDEKLRARERRVAAAMVEMKMRVDNVADVVRPDAERRELRTHVLARARADREERRHPLAQAPGRIGHGIAADPGIEDELALGMDDQIARHRRDKARSGRLRGEEQAPVELQRPAGQGIDAQHRSIVRLFRASRNGQGWRVEFPLLRGIAMLQAADLTIRLNPADDVVIARVELPAGTTLVKEANVAVATRVPAGHKVAVREVKTGQPVRRYNQIIGFATRDIHAGEHVHVHNLAMGDFERDYALCSAKKDTQYASQPATFLGIVRADGRVATRNYIGIVTSVNCSATVARVIARHFETRLEAYPNVDGVVALTHKSGCGMASDGEAIDVLRRTMAGYARHPNFFAVQVVGLGCEANQINSLLSTQSLKRHDKLHAYTIQEKGGTSKAIREGVARIEAMLADANKVQRETVPASHLTLGLQCGGSDGYSGISANPALGAAGDLPVRHGGTAILSETPEIYGAEHLLTRRAVSREVGDKLIARIKWWEDYTPRHSNEMNKQ